MKLAALWSFGSCALGLVLFCSEARAESGPAQRMRVRLDVSVAEEPEYLCVLARTIEDAVALTANSDSRGRSVDGASSAPIPPEHQVFQVQQLRGTTQDVCPTGQVSPSTTFCLLAAEGACSGCSSSSPTQPTNTAAIPAGLSVKALYHVDGDLKVQCTRNALSDRSRNAERVLLLQLHSGAEANEARLTGISLVGNLVTLQLADAQVRNIAKAIAIGAVRGDYEASPRPRFLSAENEVSLPVDAVWRTYRLELPPSHQAVKEFSWSSCGAPVVATESSEHVQPALAPTADRVTLTVEQRAQRSCLCSAEAKPCDLAQEQGTVYVLDVGAEDVVRAKLGAFEFAWKRHCAYPLEACPAVKMLGVEGSCQEIPPKADEASKEALKQCQYRCKPTEPLQGLPLDIELSTPLPEQGGVVQIEQRWPARLAAVGQTLDDYLPPEERSLLVDLGQLCSGARADEGPLACAEFTDQVLEFTQLRLPDGRLVRLRPDQTLKSIDAAGLTCDNMLSYQYFGEQGWSEDSLKVEKGRIALPSTTDDFHNLVGFSIQLGGGLSFPIQERLTSEPHATPVGKLDGVVSWRYFRKAFRRPLDLELRLGATFGEQWYETTRLGDGGIYAEPGIDVERRRIAFSRVLVHGGGTYHVPNGFFVGASTGVSNGRPLFVREEALVPMSFSLMTSARLGLKITQFFRVEGEALLILDEPTRSFEYTPLGAPTPAEKALSTLLFLMALRFDDPL